MYRAPRYVTPHRGDLPAGDHPTGAHRRVPGVVHKYPARYFPCHRDQRSARRNTCGVAPRYNPVAARLVAALSRGAATPKTYEITGGSHSPVTKNAILRLMDTA